MRARHPAAYLTLGAFAAVYLIWGSTYLGIRLATETIPPLTMAGVRFSVAGGILFPWAYLRGDRAGDRLTLRHWRSSLVIGSLLITVGNGFITLGEQHVPSGVVAVLVATVPLWMALFSRLRGVEAIGRLGAVGLACGFLGVGLLLRPGAAGGGSPVWMALTLLSPLCWATGSLYARGAVLPRRPLLGIAMEMLCGGVLLCLSGAVLGEWGQLRLGAISLPSLLAFAYLVVAGSMVGYTAYIYLLGTVSPRAASSYAYVNPLVAVFLGWAFLSEPVTATTLVASLLIVAAVAVLLATSRQRPNGAQALAELTQEIA
jgi:drug/metabolite transporter (DMT)-like permease